MYAVEEREHELPKVQGVELMVMVGLDRAEFGIADAATAREGVSVPVTVGTNHIGQEPEGAAKLVTTKQPVVVKAPEVPCGQIAEVPGVKAESITPEGAIGFPLTIFAAAPAAVEDAVPPLAILMGVEIVPVLPQILVVVCEPPPGYEICSFTQ